MDNERFYNITHILLKRGVVIEKEKVKFVILKVHKMSVEAKEIENPLLWTFTFSELFLSYQNNSFDTKGFMFVE